MSKNCLSTPLRDLTRIGCISFFESTRRRSRNRDCPRRGTSTWTVPFPREPGTIISIKSLVVLLAASLSCLAAGGAAAEDRILLAGDSWAWFMYINNAFPRALKSEGLEDCGVTGIYTTVPGSTARDWTNPDWLANIRRELEKQPTVDIIHLSVGGNDFLNHWHGEISPEEKETLYAGVVRDTEIIVRYCLGIRPAIRVAICGYDYINRKKRNATIPELNTAGQELARRKMELAQRIDRCEYIHNYGVMQYFFGYPPALKPLETAYPGQAPDFKPWPGGDRRFGNPPAAMFDAIHLSREGYYRLARHCVNVLYKKWLAENRPATTPAGLRKRNKEAGLPWSCLDFRHSLGSHLAMKGESLYKISTLMGNSPEICRRHYAALMPESLVDSVEFAPMPSDENLSPDKPKPKLYILPKTGDNKE
jgi:lysophospholipase L1-like esterase